MMSLKIAGWVANSVDLDETLHSAVSHLGLHCLLRTVCPNIYGKWCTHFIYFYGEIKFILFDWKKEKKESSLSGAMQTLTKSSPSFHLTNILSGIINFQLHGLLLLCLSQNCWNSICRFCLSSVQKKMA